MRDRIFFAPADTAGGSADGGSEPTGGGSPAPSWRDGLPDEVRSHPSLANMPDVGGLAKAYLTLEGQAGQKGVPLPADDAPAEEWDKFYAALGRPEKADGYDLAGFSVPEGLPWAEDVQKTMVGKMHELGLTNRQVVGLMSAYAEAQNGQWTSFNTSMGQAVEATEAKLKQEWGQSYAAKMDLANRVVKHAFGDDLDAAKQIQLADGSYLLDSPAIARAFARIGEAWAEDGDLPGTGIEFAKSPSEAKAEIAKLKRDPEFQKVFLDKRHPEHQAAVHRMQSLHAMTTRTT